MPLGRDLRLQRECRLIEETGGGRHLPDGEPEGVTDARNGPR